MADRIIQRLPLGECPWCRANRDQLTEEQRRAHDESLESIRKDLFPGNPRLKEDKPIKDG